MASKKPVVHPRSKSREWPRGPTATRYGPRRIRRELGHEATVEHGVLVRLHVAAAAPGLVAYAPPLHSEWLGVAVGSALGGERHGVGGSVAVKHPVVEFLRRAGPHIRGEIGIGAGQAAQTDELVNAELVRLGVVQPGRHTSLPVVVGARAGSATDSVAPVVAVGEAAAGPAIVRRADALHVLDEAAADAVEVGDLRIRVRPRCRRRSRRRGVR